MTDAHTLDGSIESGVATVAFSRPEADNAIQHQLAATSLSRPGPTRPSPFPRKYQLRVGSC